MQEIYRRVDVEFKLPDVRSTLKRKRSHSIQWFAWLLLVTLVAHRLVTLVNTDIIKVVVISDVMSSREQLVALDIQSHTGKSSFVTQIEDSEANVLTYHGYGSNLVFEVESHDRSFLFALEELPELKTEYHLDLGKSEQHFPLRSQHQAKEKPSYTPCLLSEIAFRNHIFPNQKSRYFHVSATLASPYRAVLAPPPKLA